MPLIQPPTGFEGLPFTPADLFERFRSTASMMEAEMELLAIGDAAVPVLASLFNGEAKNIRGVPYRDTDLPLRCALEVAKRLGPSAKPLEHHLRTELLRGNYVAAMALGALGTLDDQSVQALARGLDSRDIDASYESAVALVSCGATEHPFVLEVTSKSMQAANVLKKMAFFWPMRNQNESS